MNTGVYIIRNFFGGEEYIGSATIDFRKRWRSHVNALKSGTHSNWILQDVWNRFGPNSLMFSILEPCSKDKCKETEQKWMDVIKPEFNLKTTAVIAAAGNTYTDEVRALKSKMASGSSNPFFGKKHTVETKEMIGSANRGRRATEETRTKLSALLKGNKRTLGMTWSTDQNGNRIYTKKQTQPLGGQ